MELSRFQVGKVGGGSLDADSLADVAVETQLQVSFHRALFLPVFFGSRGEVQYNTDIQVS